MRRRPSCRNPRSPSSASRPRAFAPALFAGIALACGAGCSGRNIHRDLTADPSILVRQWTLETHGEFLAGDKGFEYSSPILVDQALVFGSQALGLVSIYPTLQAHRWTLPIPGGVVSELAESQGQVFFGGGDGFLYCVNADTGRVVWRYDLRNPVISRPTLHDGRAFVTTSDDTVYAFDASTGKWLWHYRRRSSPPSSIHGASAPLVDGQEVIAGLSDGFLVALSLQDGQLRWERKLHPGTKFTDVDAHPVLDGGLLYVPSYDGALYALNRKGGEVVWRFDAGGSRQVFIEESSLYLPSSNGRVYHLEKSSGKVIWQFEMDGGTPTRLVVADRHVIVASSFQYLYVLQKTSGRPEYRFNAGEGSGFASAPLYDPATRRLFALSGAGNLYTFMVRRPPRKVRKHGATDGYTF